MSTESSAFQTGGNKPLVGHKVNLVGHNQHFLKVEKEKGSGRHQVYDQQ